MDLVQEQLGEVYLIGAIISICSCLLFYIDCLHLNEYLDWWFPQCCEQWNVRINAICFGVHRVLDLIDR